MTTRLGRIKLNQLKLSIYIIGTHLHIQYGQTNVHVGVDGTFNMSSSPIPRLYRDHYLFAQSNNAPFNTLASLSKDKQSNNGGNLIGPLIWMVPGNTSVKDRDNAEVKWWHSGLALTGSDFFPDLFETGIDVRDNTTSSSCIYKPFSMV